MSVTDDEYLRKIVKEWGESHAPSTKTRARLLALASEIRAEKAIRHTNNFRSAAPFFYADSKPAESMDQPYIWFIRMSMTPLKYLA